MADAPPARKGPAFGKLKTLGQRKPVSVLAPVEAPVVPAPVPMEPTAAAAAVPADPLTVAPQVPQTAITEPLRPSRKKKIQIPPEFNQFVVGTTEEENKDRYTLKYGASLGSGIAIPDGFIPPTRKGFVGFIRRTFQAFELPKAFGEIDPDACKKRAAPPGGGKAVEPMLYQKFIREYLRSASPYRGLLVYHGLGSGKTCSSIAAAEALFGSGAKQRIIVMTPGSLRGNFQKELSFCGFRHYNTDNHWIKIPFGVDPMADMLTEIFAIQNMHIPNDPPPKKSGPGFLDRVKARAKGLNPELAAIWIPDFRPQPESPHYSDLPAEEQSAIRQQITAILENRITFINYNGITYKDLLDYTCDNREHFDDAVIIIDEVHNLTRGMQGNIGLYLEPKTITARAAKRAAESGRDIGQDDRLEPITPARRRLQYCDPAGPKKYNRSVLIYRLLAEARNSKIIALSGTPLINQADELGILINMVAGYIEGAEFSLVGTDPAQVAEFMAICKRHPRVDNVFMSKAEGAALGRTNITLTVFDRGYTKVLNDDGTFRGIEESTTADGDKGIQEVFSEIRADAEAAGIQFDMEVMSTLPGAKKEIRLELKSYPRFPVSAKKFNPAFIDTNDASVKNEDILRTRMMGFISYFKGATEGLMPDVGVDEYVYVPLREYAAQYYSEKRHMEMELEKLDKGGEGGEEDDPTATNPAAYRFNTRAACNFAFPKAIPRPYRNGSEKSTEEMADKEEAVVMEEGDTASVLDPEMELVEPAADIYEMEGEDEAAPAGAPLEQEGGANEVAEEIQLGGANEVAEEGEEEGEVAEEAGEESVEEALKAATEEALDASTFAVEPVDDVLPAEQEATEINPLMVPGPDVIPVQKVSPITALREMKQGVVPPTSPEDPDNPPPVKKTKQYFPEPKKPKPAAAPKPTKPTTASVAEEEGLTLKIPAAGKKGPGTVAATAATSTGATIIGTTANYLQRLHDALAKLDRNKEKLLRLDGPPQSNLAYFSPKYAAMLNKIQESPGSALVYSQFKTSEGLGIFGYALKANGYAEIRVAGSDENPYFPEDVKESLLRGSGQKRFIFFTGEGSKVIRRIILNIFNANFDQLPLQIKEVLLDPRTGFAETKNHHGEICSVIGITGAGAEGISLKAVRSVHIMEPYWNKVRTEQVKGRAIRLCSHEDLPIEERKVDIYTYIAHFTPEDIAGRRIDETIISWDGGETTDVHILKIGERKEKILQSFINAMKEAAVDCFQNAAQNDEKVITENPDGTKLQRDLVCFPGMAGSPEEASFHPNFDVHMSDKGGEKRKAVDVSTLVPASMAKRVQLLPSAAKVMGLAGAPTTTAATAEAPKSLSVSEAVGVGALPEIRSTKTEVKEKRTIVRFPPGTDNQYILKEDKSSPGEVAWLLYKYPGGEMAAPYYRVVDNPITGKKMYKALKR